MNSKTSLLNRTIFRKNIIRFWPAWALYAAILAFVMPISIYTNVNMNLRVYERAEAVTRGVADAVASAVRTNLLLVFAMSILFAVLLFGYLFGSASCSMYHSLPTSRKQLFFTGYLNGILFLVVPQAVMALISIAIGASWGSGYMTYIGYWLGTAVMISVLFFSEAVICCMLSGHEASTVAYYIGGNILYAGLKLLVMSVTSWLCYGISYSTAALQTKDVCLSPIAYLYKKLSITYIYDDVTGDITGYDLGGVLQSALYLLPAAVMVILALVLYKKRSLECAGDFVAFEFLRPALRWLVAFVMGVGLAFVISYSMFGSGKYAPVAMIVLSACITFMFFFFTEMVLAKNFRVFTARRAVGACVCAAAALFLPLALETDLFGIEKKVPDAGDVKCLYISAAYPRFLTDTDGILAGEEVHRTIIDDKEDYEEYMRIADMGTSEEILNTTYTYVHMVYYLKNGTEIERTYSIPGDASYQADSGSAVAKIAELLESPESYLSYAMCKNYREAVFTGGSMDTYTKSTDGYVYGGVTLTPGQAAAVSEAALRDIQEGNYPYGVASQLLDYENDCYSNSLYLTWKMDGQIEYIYDDPAVPDDYPQEYGYTYYRETADLYFTLYGTCEHTIQALVDTGVISDTSELVTYAEMNEQYESVG